MFLTAHLGRKLNGVIEESASTMREVRSAARLMRESAEQQRGYYRDSASAIKATSKAAFIATRNLARLIEHLDRNANTFGINADSRMEEVTLATVGAMGAVEKQVTASGYQAEQLLGDARGAVRNLEALTGNPALAHAAVNLEAATAHTAKTAENLEAATASIREMLSPKKKSFWRRVLELMIPRPTINLGR